MTPGQIETALKFFMSKLPENELAELDAQMEGASLGPSDGLAQDSARRDWLNIGPAARLAVRKSRQGRLAQDGAARTDYEKRFPDANRLK